MNDMIAPMYATLEALNPEYIDIQDNGHLHKGHAHEHGGHYTVTIISTCFTGLNRIDRHRLVHRTLQDSMRNIHALAIRALTPEET